RFVHQHPTGDDRPHDPPRTRGAQQQADLLHGAVHVGADGDDVQVGDRQAATQLGHLLGLEPRALGVHGGAAVHRAASSVSAGSVPCAVRRSSGVSSPFSTKKRGFCARESIVTRLATCCPAIIETDHVVPSSSTSDRVAFGIEGSGCSMIPDSRNRISVPWATTRTFWPGKRRSSASRPSKPRSATCWASSTPGKS